MKKLLILIGTIKNKMIEEIAKKHITSSSKIYINPESELSLKEQIAFAKEIALRLSKDKEIILITESDYIIKELNTYIMLSKLEGDIRKELLSRYEIREEYIINADIIKGFEVYNGELVKLEILNEGIISKCIDEAINYINNKSDDIFYSMDIFD